MADNVEIQGLEFQIVGNASEANQGLKALTSTLKKLQSVTSKGLGLTAVANDVRQFNEAVGEMDTTGITSMADAIRTIGSSSRMLSTVRGHLQAISDMDFSRLTQAANVIGTITANVSNTNPITTPAAATTPVTGAIPAETATATGSTQTVEQASAAMNRASTAGERLKSVLNGVGTTLKTIGKVGVKGIATGITYPFLNTAKSIKSATKGAGQFLSSIKRIAMYRAIRLLLSGITKALKDGINNLNAYSKTMGTTFHQSLNTIATDALFLKNSLAAAVAPIINALAPAIDFLADKVAHLLNLLAQLFARLSGKSTYTKAVKAATEYGNAVGGAAEKAKSFTAGFDELNVFDPNSGGGGGGGLGDVSKMFEEATIGDEISSFADRLRELFLSGSWYELGATIGAKFNEIVDSISWDKLGTKIGKGFTAAVQTAYGFMKTVDFSNLGKSIATAINHAVENMDFGTFGRLIIRGFTAMIDTVGGLLGGLDWGLLASKASDYLIGAFDEASEWFKSIDWTNVGETLWKSIKDCVSNIDFSGIAKSFFTLLGTAIRSAAQFLGGFFGSIGKDIKKWWDKEIKGENWKETAKNLLNAIGEGFKNIGTWVVENIAYPFLDALTGGYFTEQIELAGGDIVAGFFGGIGKAFENVGTWIKTNIVDPFVKFFKDLFGIKSPSTVMAEIGGYVVEGFFKGVGTFRNFRSTISEWAGAVVEWFRKGEDGKGIVEHFKEFGSNVVTGFKDKVGTTYQTVKTNVTTWASGVKDWFTNGSYGGVNRTTFSNYANEVISGFREKVGATYQTVKSNITTWASNVRDWFTNSSYGGVNSTNFATYANNIITGFKDKVGSTYSTVKSSITTWASGVKDWFSGSSYGGVNSTTFGTYASNVLNGFKNYISNNYTNVKSSMTTFASKVKSWFTDTVSYNSFYQVAADVVSGFKNGIGNLYQTCKNTISSWGSSIIAWFKDKLDSNSPSKVFERIGEDTIRGYNLGINALGGTTKGVVTSWANSFTGVKPTMSFAVDTSALKYYDSKSFAQSIVPNVNSNHNFTVAGIAEAMQEFYHEYVEPTMMQMAEDMRRQADKKEQTVVQIGNRTITDAVTTQRNANGYQFTTA